MSRETRGAARPGSTLRPCAPGRSYAAGCDQKLWRQPSPFGEITGVVSDRGLREISLPGDDQPAGEASKPDRAIQKQLDDWFAGRLHAFDVDLDLEGIHGFHLQVLETLAHEVG